MSIRIPTIALAALTLGLSAAGTATGHGAPTSTISGCETQLHLRSRVDALASRLVESDVGRVLGVANRPMVENGSCDEDAFPASPRATAGSASTGRNSGAGPGTSRRCS